MSKKSFKKDQRPKEEREFDQKVIDLARVTRVMAGGKRMRFRACVAIGDKKGTLGFASAKGADVTNAINKAVNKAKKNLFKIQIINDTIAHRVDQKFKAAKVMIKPAPKGSGIKAGGAMRLILELAGIPNVVGKILGSKNKINIVKATSNALKSLKKRLETEKPKVKQAIVPAIKPVAIIQAKKTKVEKKEIKNIPEIKNVADKGKKEKDNKK